MSRRLAWIAGAALAGLAAAGACGDVPTLPGGVAFITPIITPAPSVAYGDTLRDSLGRVVPLHVYAIDRKGDTLSATVRWLFTTFNTPATVDANGVLVAPDSLASLRLVAQVTEAGGATGLQLQTPELAIEVVPRADTIFATGTLPDTGRTPFLVPLSVTITGVGPKGVRGPVGGLRVGYRIAAVYPATTAGRQYLTDDGGNVLRADSTAAVDTTASNGTASRSFAWALAPPGERETDSVVVEARASSHRGVPLAGSPVRFVVRIRP